MRQTKFKGQKVPTVLYVIYQDYFGKAEIVGTATDAKERDKKVVGANFTPGSGSAFWVKYTTKQGKGNFGEQYPTVD